MQKIRGEPQFSAVAKLEADLLSVYLPRNLIRSADRSIFSMTATIAILFHSAFFLTAWLRLHSNA